MATREPFLKDRLFCPGPTPVPLPVKLAAAEQTVYHRTQDFYNLFQSCRERLAPFFGSKNLPVLLASSGTGAMEAAITNLTDVGDRILVINAGKFGERWQKLGSYFGCNVVSLDIDWGNIPQWDQIAEVLRRYQDWRAVFLQANETSTAVALPIQELIPKIRQSTDALIVVDAVSGLCAHQVDMDAWGIDCVVAGSQKGFGIDPGLAFICLSDRAVSRMGQRPRFYFDLRRELIGQAKGESAWTPATSLIVSLDKALETLTALTPNGVVTHHARLAEAVRRGGLAMGLKLFAQAGHSNAVTAFTVPDGVDGKKLIKVLAQQYGTIFAGGQDKLAGKIVRFSHLGFVDIFDVISGLAALELALHHSGHSCRPGAGTAAALEFFR